MALVGNGFDIQVTRRYRTKFSPRYAAFYHYLRARDFDSSNLVVMQMAQLKSLGLANWSDLEHAIDMLINAPPQPLPAGPVYEATVAIQAAFSEYLDLVAPPDLLAMLGRDSAAGELSVRSMARFVGDLASNADFDRFKFPSTTTHYDLFNFLFVNFNYTPILDDYNYLDHDQWQPRAHRSADRNFWFFPNPTGDPRGHGDQNTSWSSYLRAEVVHPHGQQSIPRSLLFGIDAPDGFDPGRHPNRTLMKPYWARNNIEFAHLFPEVRLFIIFGCALGPSDGWWWRRIVESLDQGVVDEAAASELIIYWWKDGNSVERSDDIIDRFFAGAGVGARDAVRRRVQGQIHVVTYTDDTPPVWLATP
jgi:hypothetical protein